MPWSDADTVCLQGRSLVAPNRKMARCRSRDQPCRGSCRDKCGGKDRQKVCSPAAGESMGPRLASRRAKDVGECLLCFEGGASLLILLGVWIDTTKLLEGVNRLGHLFCSSGDRRRSGCSLGFCSARSFSFL